MDGKETADKIISLSGTVLLQDTSAGFFSFSGFHQK